MADYLELLGLIQKNHPDIFVLLSKPGVAKVAMDMAAAEASGMPWSQAQLEAALHATDYYRSSDAQQRSWDVLNATDPASARTKIENTKRIVQDLQTQLGIKFGNPDAGLGSMEFAFLVNAVTYGWTPEQIKYNMLASVNKDISGGGDLGAAAVSIKKQFDDYGVPMSDKAVMDWALKLNQGAVDAQAILGYAQQTAMSIYPGLKDAISRGVTVRQYADPYLQIAQQELGISTENVSLTDPKWLRAINTIDPSTGARVSMSLNDWTSVVRSDPTYGYDRTEKATTQAASFATQLAQKMGATG